MSVEHAIVIGSGFGGLSAAVRLRAMGYKVTVLEANEQAGGRASVFKRDGFIFDAGPTVVTAPYLMDELFTLVGRNPKDYYDIVPVDPFYRVKFQDSSVFDYVGDEDRLLHQIEQFNPKDVDGYRKMAAMAQRIFDVGYTQLADVPFDTVSEMLRIVPQMMKLKSYRTVYGLVASYIEDPRLRQVFTFQPLLVGGNPFNTTSIYMLIHWLERKWGVHFAKGGTGALINALTRLLDELGVELRLNTPVERIEVTNGRASAVETASGERIPCDLVVSNADPSMVYTKMIAPEHRRTNTDASIGRIKQSMSLFVMYFGAKGVWKDTAHHTILLGPRYKELLRDIFDRRVLADDFSLYLHAPGRSDPSLNPPGHDGFYVLSPVPNNKSGVDWEKTAEGYGEKIIDALDAGELPGLKKNLVTKFSVDPRYFAGRLRSMDGAAFGSEPILTQSAWFRTHNRSEDVQGLYFVGAGTHPGAGMPGVLCSSKVLPRIVPAPARPLALPESRLASK